MSVSFAPVAGAIVDAWAELRAHKLRVLLSLIGIAVSVGVLTAVVALGEYQRQATIEQSDRYGGRVATLQVNAISDSAQPLPWDTIDEQFRRVLPRYAFEHTGRVAQGMSVPVEVTDGFRPVNVTLVDPDYALMHRQVIAHGRSLSIADADLMSPAILVSDPLWQALGSPDPAAHPTVTLGGDVPGTYQIVGVLPSQGEWDTDKSLIMLYDAYRSRVDRLPPEMMVSREVWIGEALVDKIGPTLATDMRAGMPAGVQIQVNRADWATQPGAMDGIIQMQLVFGGIAALVLALGALSLINVQLVAMRQRIREIGVRRAFGATAPRVFSTVVLESLVATLVAGVLGVALAVAVLRGGLAELMFSGMEDIPPFPFLAAVVGLVASVVVGALAGLIPAIVAVRVKVIDAIRY